MTSTRIISIIPSIRPRPLSDRPGKFPERLPDLFRRKRLGHESGRAGLLAAALALSAFAAALNTMTPRPGLLSSSFGSSSIPFSSLNFKSRKAASKCSAASWRKAVVAVLRDRRFVAHSFQRDRGDPADVRFIINDQHAHGIDGSSEPGVRNDQ